jgi:hypothetical protein
MQAKLPLHYAAALDTRAWHAAPGSFSALTTSKPVESTQVGLHKQHMTSTHGAVMQ